MPLLLPAIATDLKWSKTESGTVLSSFFWGYTVTQVGVYPSFEPPHTLESNKHNLLFLLLSGIRRVF